MSKKEANPQGHKKRVKATRADIWMVYLDHLGIDYHFFDEKYIHGRVPIAPSMAIYVDFWPTTGRWKIINDDLVIRDGHDLPELLAWLYSLGLMGDEKHGCHARSGTPPAPAPSAVRREGHG
jgi:hypothetical protein